MREYETTVIVQPEISNEGLGALQERLDGVLETTGSIRLLYDDLGKRRLAYEIQNFQKGRYVMVRFLDEGSGITGLERAFRLEDSILRYLTVQVDDSVADVEERKAAAVEEERVRAEKAAERAAREAEEAKRQEAEAIEVAKLAEEARVAKEASANGDEAPSGDSETSEPVEAAADADSTATESSSETAKGKEEGSS